MAGSYQTSGSLAVGRPAAPLAWYMRWLLIGLGLAGVGGYLAYTFLPWERGGEGPTAVESRLTVSGDDHDLDHVKRRDRPDLVFHVQLTNAPVGRRLWLACDWLGPDGEIAHQSHYQTQPIDSPDMATQTAIRLPTDAALGRWKVRLSLHGQCLAEREFEVK